MSERVAILADDLIWASRLSGSVRAAGAIPVGVRGADALASALADGVQRVIVDLTARAYDGVAVIATIAPPVRVLAVGQHDDQESRRAALAAGAERVLAYRKLFEDGPAVIGAWLARRPAESGPSHEEAAR